MSDISSSSHSAADQGGGPPAGLRGLGGRGERGGTPRLLRQHRLGEAEPPRAGAALQTQDRQ